MQTLIPLTLYTMFVFASMAPSWIPLGRRYCVMIVLYVFPDVPCDQMFKKRGFFHFVDSILFLFYNAFVTLKWQVVIR